MNSKAPNQKSVCQGRNIKVNPRLLIYIIIFALFSYVVLTRFDEISSGLKALGGADWRWVAVVVAATSMTYVVAAYSYVMLATSKLRYGVTLAVQAAASFANRLIPSGVGGLGLNADYLYKSGHKPAEVSSVMAMNSSLAFISSLLLTFFAVMIDGGSIRELFDGKALPIWVVLIGMGVLIGAGVVLTIFESMRKRISKFIADTWQNLLEYRHRKLRVVLAMLSATLVTVFYVSALYASAHAIGLLLSFPQAFIAYTVGTLIGAAVPTPGGIGGVEAGLYGGLVAFGFDGGLGLSTVIIYRFVSYWLPILPGYLSFWLLQRKKII